MLRLLFLTLLLMAGVNGADPWSQLVSRKPSEWSQADIQRLLNESPWSVAAQAVMDDPGDRSDPTPAPPPSAAQPGAPGNGSSGPTQARWDGGIGRNRMGHLPTIPVQVRWESATIIRSAFAQALKPMAENLANAALKDYILSVTGLIPAHRYRTQTLVGSKKSSSSETADPADPEEVLEAFMVNSRLAWKGGSIQPENVKLDADSGTIHIFFPRADLSQHNREVVFATSFGSMRVQTRFRLKEMSVQGKPDL